MEEKKEEDMDVAEDMYVASDLYEEDEVETGIRRGASPTRDGGPSPPSSPGILPSASCMGDQRVVLQVRTKKVRRRQGE